MFVFRLAISVGLVLYLVGCQARTLNSASILRPAADPETVSLKRDDPRPAAMVAGSEVVPPFGYIGFCLRHTQECESGTDAPATVEMTPAKWRDLAEVNAYVNKTIKPVEDINLYKRAEWWTYPNPEGGDCEDYALLKRKLLIERGWPADALLLSVVKEWNGAGHAVLTVVTGEGDYVLDNQAKDIVLWKDAPYTWVKRQSRKHPYVWVNLDPEREARIRTAAKTGTPDAAGKKTPPVELNSGTLAGQLK